MESRSQTSTLSWIVQRALKLKDLAVKRYIQGACEKTSFGDLTGETTNLADQLTIPRQKGMEHASIWPDPTLWQFDA
ncbi:hypothetical protein GGD56_006886 [Rhizobium mongolense]|uniref:Uncharacterized protein n=2 Tax=Rhizobium mongolense TaxID=57676 RepID=A0ABR6IYI7_9HYPH|nr:hypothetical protein [Rhizobium mongolense]TVZ74729.1 hypothetical protein BCL32_0023 [Rhizobium mongolense USDA 1844]